MRSIEVMTSVQEVFFYVHVGDVQRAEAFYVNALGATVDFASPTWSSLVIAGVRVNLVLRDHEAPSVGLHFLVDDVALACAAVATAGGVITPAIETAGGVLAEVLDTEGNTFTLRQRRKCITAQTAVAA
jgi:predicted enzyme related to lactoylglutathione lyase